MSASALARAFFPATGSPTDLGGDRGSGTDHLEMLYRASGGHLAKASRFLDARRYAEGRCAFLACRALDAFEDLTREPRVAVEGIRKVSAYLTGQSDELPDAALLHSRRYSDDLECAVVRALPALRASLDSLDAHARLRVNGLIGVMADGMGQDPEAGTRRGDERYGAAVLGSACAYGFALLDARSDAAPDFAAIGTLLQAANDLRDLEFDAPASRHGVRAERELELNLTVAEMAPQVLGCLGQMRFARWSRARGAVAYLTLATARFFMRRSGLVPVGPVRRPLMAGTLAVASQAVYERVLLEGEALIQDCIVRGCAQFTGAVDRHADRSYQPARRSRQQSMLEDRILADHPDPRQAQLIGHGARLLHATLRLCGELPARPLQPLAEKRPDAALLMVSDYLLACAVSLFARLGADTVAEVGVSAAALARAAHDGSGCGDARGEIARLLSTLVGRARGLPVEQIERNASRDQQAAAQLYRTDRTPWWRWHFRSRRTQVAVTGSVGLATRGPRNCQ